MGSSPIVGAGWARGSRGSASRSRSLRRSGASALNRLRTTKYRRAASAASSARTKPAMLAEKCCSRLPSR